MCLYLLRYIQDFHLLLYLKFRNFEFISLAHWRSTKRFNLHATFEMKMAFITKRDICMFLEFTAYLFRHIDCLWWAVMSLWNVHLHFKWFQLILNIMWRLPTIFAWLLYSWTILNAKFRFKHGWTNANMFGTICPIDSIGNNVICYKRQFVTVTASTMSHFFKNYPYV